MIKDSQCILTSYEEGTLVQATGIFKVAEKVGNTTIVRKKFLKDVKIPSSVQSKTTLNEASVSFFSSNEGICKGYDGLEWAKMSDKARLKANLRNMVGHDHFSFKLL